MAAKNTAVISDPTSSPWRAIHRDWANPAQAVSSHRLMLRAPKISVLNRYQPISAAQPRSGLVSVPEAAASATVSTGTANRMIAQRQALNRQSTTRDSSLRTPARPSANQLTSNDEPSRATNTSHSSPGALGTPSSSGMTIPGTPMANTSTRNMVSGYRCARLPRCSAPNGEPAGNGAALAMTNSFMSVRWHSRASGSRLWELLVYRRPLSATIAPM